MGLVARVAGGRFGARPLSALIACALLTLGFAACGGSSRGRTSSLRTARAASNASAADLLSPASSVPGFKGDEEDDDPTEAVSGAGKPFDNDSDLDNDAGETHKRFYDSDDGISLGAVRAADAADERALAAVAQRYRAAAAAGDGVRACALLERSLAGAVPEDYGQAPGPGYLRGGKTCAAVMSRLFRHLHAQLAASAQVTKVLVGVGRADVVLGSKTIPASYMLFVREGAAWKTAHLLPVPLP
jgi:hypothetical protein